jgi:hypothetical protein
MIGVVRNEEPCGSIRKKPGFISTRNPKQIYHQSTNRWKRKSNLKVVAYNLVVSPRTEITDEKATFRRVFMAHDDRARSFPFSELLMADLSAQAYHRTFLRT